ncbi:MAG: hypothetical protein RMJ53_10245, partial [Chitinophagales bacterium]|nr:hypothetical protein [Chitinophagales bacterium]
MKNYLIVTLFFLLLGTYSCKKEAPVKSPENFPDTPVGNFEAFWHGMSRYYAFWEYEKTDWDKIYDEYSKKVNENTTPEELQKYIGEMIRNLRDHHLNVKGAINDTPFVLIPRRMFNNYQQYHF